MKYIVIKAPKLTDEAAASLQDFLFELMEAFDEHYDSQIARFYYQSDRKSMPNINVVELDEEPPF